MLIQVKTGECCVHFYLIYAYTVNVECITQKLAPCIKATLAFLAVSQSSQDHSDTASNILRHIGHSSFSSSSSSSSERERLRGGGERAREREHGLLPGMKTFAAVALHSSVHCCAYHLRVVLSQ